MKIDASQVIRDEAELAAIRLLLSLCREYGFRLHIVHLATSRALEELQSARASGLPVTVETCPHYLHLDAETIPDGATLAKCAPPIRSRDNREKLWQGLRDRIIDMAFERGVLFLGCGETSVRLSPPLTISQEEATIAMDILEECIAAQS